MSSAPRQLHPDSPGTRNSNTFCSLVGEASPLFPAVTLF
jgi:hypothetical protein